MSTCPLADLEFEALIKNIRSQILLKISKKDKCSSLLNFQSALALQCFTNEYLYIKSDNDAKALKKVEAFVSEAVSNSQEPNPEHLLCIASYKPLGEYEWCDKIRVTSDIEEVFKRQVLEPKNEKNLGENIPKLKQVTNQISYKVKQQYEENPYPRWVNLRLHAKPSTVKEVTELINLKIYDNSINNISHPQILVAGCGTGQHSIATASRFKNSQVLAVDLSQSSLAYAKRKLKSYD